MKRSKRFLVVASVAGAMALTSISAEAFFGPFGWMRSGGWGGPWGGWGGPWGGWGGPWYGYGYGYPYYGGWGYPYHGLGYPYGLASPWSTPLVVTQPATSSADK